MLYSMVSQKKVRDIPYQKDYKRWRARLPEEDYKAILSEFIRRIEGSEIQTSSWMPGKDWSGTVFDPIYSKACQHDYAEAAQFFGLLLWETVLNHPDCWAFARYELEDVPVQELTYFKVDSKVCSGK